MSAEARLALALIAAYATGVPFCIWLLETLRRRLANRRLRLAEGERRGHELRQLVAESSAIADYMSEPRWFRATTLPLPPRPPPTSVPSSGVTVRQ